MKLIVTLLLVAMASPGVACDASLLDWDFRRLASSENVNLCDSYAGRVVLVVNTASKCGNTPQYDGLEKLYSQHRGDGLSVLGFPSNDFFGQEPGTEEQIQEFCRLTYRVKFPMFEKTRVTGQDAHPFFTALAEEAGTPPRWNFHKYLIDRQGRLVADFSPGTHPYDEKLVQAIEEALDAS